MKPSIKHTQFGSINIQGEVFRHDVVIRLNGQVKKRKKKLSKAVYGTSHTISLDEIKHIYQKGAEQIILGAGQYGLVKLSEEAADFLRQKGCQVTSLPTPKAVKAWNQAQGSVIGLFHITC
jgi:hypothetical protein